MAYIVIFHNITMYKCPTNSRTSFYQKSFIYGIYTPLSNKIFGWTLKWQNFSKSTDFDLIY